MLKKLQIVAVLVCMLSYASAGPVSIGTASARGDMRVDSYTVKGNATLFDGSIVETGQATADLRLGKSTEITMSTGSRGTLYFDRLVLQRGESELSAPSSFQVEANGLRVTPNEPNTRGVVSVKSATSVEVAALTGSFGVTNGQGVLLASVHPGKPLSFAMQASTLPNPEFSGTGIISTEGGHYFISFLGVTYELTGKDLRNEVGKTVTINGKIVAGATPDKPALAVVEIADSKVVAGYAETEGGLSTKSLIIGGVAIAAGIDTAIGVYEANQSSAPASQ
jgi:hypothetical protein